MRETEGNLIRIATVACVCVSLALAASLDAQELTDSQISQAVEGRLLSQEGVPYDRIDVSIDDGVVTVSGTVRNKLEVRQRPDRRPSES